MSKKVLKAENFVADGICVMKEEPQGIWQVASVNQWVKNGNEIAELFASAPELLKQNKALLEALEDWNKSFKSVLDHGVYFDNNVFTLFNQRYVQSEKAIAEAIQGEPPTYGINPVKDGVLKFKNQDGTGKE